MLDEKRTAAALKEAWRCGGYRVVIAEDQIAVRCANWGFRVDAAYCPPKVLGLIVEHVGELPEDGVAFHLQKDKPVQSVMLDNELSFWENLVKELDDEKLAYVQQTPLHLGSDEIWQEQRGLHCLRIDPEYSRIIETGAQQNAETVYEKRDRLIWRLSGLAIVTAKTREEGDVLERLESYPWCGEGTE